MIIGFKTGPRNFEEGQRIVEEDHAQLCEMWFDVTRANIYDDMIGWLQEQNVVVGLHHWGLVDGQYKTNLATNNSQVRKETIQQIKTTIDIGARINCAYVNAHPGARYLERNNFVKEAQELVPHTETPTEESDRLFLEATQELHEYAEQKGVLLTIETLPAAEAPTPRDRENKYEPGNVPLPIMQKMCEQGGYIANDITHTAGQLALDSADKKSMWTSLLSFTNAIKNQTRLLHINTVTPPYNGTDSHDGVTDEDFSRESFPSREQIKELLSVFKDTNVFVVPEPQTGTMQANYRTLKTIVSEI